MYRNSQLLRLARTHRVLSCDVGPWRPFHNTCRSCRNLYSTSSEIINGIQCQFEKDRRVATLSINNPKKMNIVNSSILSQLTTTCEELSKDQDLRAVIITGAPTAEGKSPSFIGGADIKEMYSLSSPEEARTFITGVHKACQALRDLPVPVIARVNGFSLGAGLEIMISCDLRVATQESHFGMPEVRVGIPSVVEAALLPQLIGFGRTRRLLYLAEIINGREAKEWGLIEEVVQDVEGLDRIVDDWVSRLCEMGPTAIRQQKRLMMQWEHSSIAEGIQAGTDEFALAFESNDGQEPREYMGRFLNRARGQ